MSEKRKRFRFKNLDATRFIAFMGVFLSHAFVTNSNVIRDSETFKFLNGTPDNNADGYLSRFGTEGVEYFFVLSGFLISWVILKEVKKKNKFKLKKFLIRRTLRIWPLYFAIAGFGYFFYWWATAYNFFEINPLPEFYYFGLFIVNFFTIENGMDYLFFLTFLWTISVEEQFYILWGFLMKFFRNYYVAICLIMVAISIGARWYYLDNDAHLKFNTLCILGNFGIGGLAAYAAYKKSKLIEWFKSLSKTTISSIYLFLLLSILFYEEYATIDFFVVIKRVFFSLLYVFVILEQSYAKDSVIKLGKIRVFNFLGKLSYGENALTPVKGYKMLLTIVDRLSNFLQIVPLRNKGWKHIRDRLIEHWFSKFGLPKLVHTDQGIISKDGHEWLESLGIEINYSAAYAHKQNGLSERMNRYLDENFKIYKLEKERGKRKILWPEAAQLIGLKYNSGYSTAIGMSPYYFMFRKRARGAFDEEWQILNQDLDHNQLRSIEKSVYEKKMSEI